MNPNLASAGAIRLVTFDLDDTLWLNDRVIRRAEDQMWQWLQARGADVQRPTGHKVAAIRKAVLCRHPDAEHDISRLRELMMRTMLEHGGHAPAEAAALAAGAFAEFLDWRHRVEFLPDALRVLAQLRTRYTLAALTNGNADYRRLGLDRYFAFGYCAADVGASKPDPAMFERALARANVPAHQAVHVGDHPVNDIQGASAVGMATIQVAHEPPAEANGWLDRPNDGPGVRTSGGASLLERTGVCDAHLNGPRRARTVRRLIDLPRVIATLSQDAPKGAHPPVLVKPVRKDV